MAEVVLGIAYMYCDPFSPSRQVQLLPHTLSADSVLVYHKYQAFRDFTLIHVRVFTPSRLPYNMTR